jgi:catechol 2,3-dioxygenase-like lactoylglutathione lyase family enzyme
VTTSTPRLSHVFVHVTDLAASRMFYVEQLGLRVLMEEPGYLRVGSTGGFHIGMEEDPAVGSEGIEIVIEVPDVDVAYRRLEERGVAFDQPPADMPWGARHAWLRDPSGYRLSIYTPSA